MPILHVNIDHIATIREARKTNEPDPVYAAFMAEQSGASGITIHLREDRRHIQDRDLKLIRQTVQTTLNLEMAATEEMVNIALETKPNIVTLVPEKREEVTTEGGLDCVGQEESLKKHIERLTEAGIRVSLFIDPEQNQIDTSKRLGAQDIELHTGEYANATTEEEREKQLKRLQEGGAYAHKQGLGVNAGHGLTYFNIKPILTIPHLKELNIGHSIISRSTCVGLPQAVKDMLALIEE